MIVTASGAKLFSAWPRVTTGPTEPPAVRRRPCTWLSRTQAVNASPRGLTAIATGRATPPPVRTTGRLTWPVFERVTSEIVRRPQPAVVHSETAITAPPSERMPSTAPVTVSPEKATVRGPGSGSVGTPAVVPSRADPCGPIGPAITTVPFAR